MRIERVDESNGIRSITVLQPRQRFADLPLRRLRVAAGAAEPPARALARRPEAEQAMARRLLREGLDRWRQWNRLVAKPPAGFIALIAEETLLPLLCRCGAIQLVERWSAADDDWRPGAFRTEPAGAAVLGHVSAERWRAQLLSDLASDDLLAAAQVGPKAPMRWPALAFVLRAAERWRELDAHGARPRPRELAAQIEHSKMWTPARRKLFSELLGSPFVDLFPTRPRQLRIKGPVEHPQAAIWAESVDQIPLRVLPEAQGVVCVENLETFEHLLAHTAAGWIVLQVPGGPPPAHEYVSYPPGIGQTEGQ